MPSYKLTYFNVPGRAEVIRYLFALANQDFEDHRVEGQQWGRMKSGTSWGCLPELVIDGETFVQTGAIVRYLATKFGMMGNDEKEYLLIDMITCCTDDITTALVPMRFEKDDAKKAQLLKDFKEKLVFWLPKLEGILQRNNDGAGWFVGDSVSPADVYVYHTLSLVMRPCKAEVSKHSTLMAHYDRFGKLPQIAAWLKKRP